MAEREPYSGARWQSGSLQPDQLYEPAVYSATPRGEVRRAELRDQHGVQVGHVWTDNQAAAGFLPAEQAGAAGVQAAAYVWTVHKELYARQVPAAEVLDPALYEPAYQLHV